VMHWQQPRGLFFKPLGRLLDLASGTVSIATTASDPMLSTTAITLVDDPAQFAGATTHDGAEHFAMTKRNVVSKSFQVCRCVLPQGIRDRRHALTLAPPKDLFDRLPCIGLGGLGQMQIDHRRLQAAVTEVLLDHFQRHARFE